jgi:hypothetical protein
VRSRVQTPGMPKKKKRKQREKEYRVNGYKDLACANSKKEQELNILVPSADWSVTSCLSDSWN